MKIPRPVLVLALIFAFPLCIALLFTFQMASAGELFISTQLSLLCFMVQRYFWTEAEYFQVKRFFLFKR